MDLADTYITFVRQNQDILRDRVNDELYIEKVFDVSTVVVSNTKYHIFMIAVPFHSMCDCNLDYNLFIYFIYLFLHS